ncbi:type III-B CRISPR module RAMP protein Cmr6 [Meiothermus sp. QL-1]|uniref:type III-B CRISPR module RAMP protein Cmr6 n=1 Tax=Meiothermus sp. QL-1 TaxID=2058095 RepID=UPI000E0C3D51|nr:type III-B CRISPR module RAMP protein Cmr6 [Meiothermus sp. QL-1]RDI95590.1 type III-B CRISPR module RAMP protein Cmr6 [Meiothermus sp. QL-1]
MRASRLDLSPPSHAGLALQRYLLEHDDQKEAVRELLKHIANTPVPPVYRDAFARWQRSLGGAVWLEAATRTPLAIGLGNSSPLENGLALHHTYGVPYLPGSALKGLLRRVAERYGLSQEEKAVLLGEGPDPKGKKQGSAAYLVYWDGWLDPQSEKPFQQDVIAVHHPVYYRSRGRQAWPTDFDDPNPVAFLSVRPGVRFHIPITCPAENAQDWPYKAAEMLKWGLEHLGLGGKTNAGYGYFGDFRITVPERLESLEERVEEVERQTREVLEQVNDASALSKIDNYLPKIEFLEPAVRRSSLEAIKAHLEAMKRWDMTKSRCRKIQTLLEET